MIFLIKNFFIIFLLFIIKKYDKDNINFFILKYYKFLTFYIKIKYLDN